MPRALPFVLFALAALASLRSHSVSADPPPKANKYIGAEKCRNCHEAKTKGSQYSTWKAMKHAHAWDALATDDAKKLAKERGIGDPQTSEKCVKCHQTAFGEPAANIAPGFDAKAGVQCESCHGPGGNHMKARMASEDEEDDGGLVEIPDDEIVKAPKAEVCKKCHNEESPNYKPFTFKEFEPKIRHLDPRRKRTQAELDALAGEEEKEK